MSLALELFGFQALWSPLYFIVLLFIVISYFALTVKFKNNFAGSEPITKKQGFLFVTSIIVLYVMKGSPIDLMGHLVFTVHMVQMAILCLLVPPLLIVGIPQWIWRKVINLLIIKNVFNFFTKPLVALILFNGLFSLYHIPLLFDVIKTNMWYHAFFTILLFIVSLFMWWPLVNQLPEQQSLSGLKKIGYIFVDGILITPACALIIFGNEPLYATFSEPRVWVKALELCVPVTTLASINLSGPEMFNSMSLVQDQQTGGVIMKILQEIIYGIVLTQVFFDWYRTEKEQEIIGVEKNLNNQNSFPLRK